MVSQKNNFKNLIKCLISLGNNFFQESFKKYSSDTSKNLCN